MREAGRINALALAAAKALIRPGVTTIELDKAAEEVIRKHGAIPTFLGVPGAYPYPNTIYDQYQRGVGSRDTRESVNLKKATSYRLTAGLPSKGL